MFVEWIEKVRMHFQIALSDHTANAEYVACTSHENPAVEEKMRTLQKKYLRDLRDLRITSFTRNLVAIQARDGYVEYGTVSPYQHQYVGYVLYVHTLSGTTEDDGADAGNSGQASKHHHSEENTSEPFTIIIMKG